MAKKLNPDEVIYVRNEIVKIMSKYNKSKPPIKLEIDGELLQQILFERYTDINNGKMYYGFIELFKRNEIYEKIDFSNVPLNNVCMDEEDLSKYKGIKIDPQIIWNKSLVGTICMGVEFVGSFDDVCILATDFRGSRGAKIDPQTVRNQDFLMTQYNEGDIEFVGSFKDCINMNFNARMGRR